MRTRKEIVDSCHISDLPNMKVLEVLLDIRDLLIKKERKSNKGVSISNQEMFKSWKKKGEEGK